MRRDLRIALLSAGVVLGFGSGFHALQMRHWQRRHAWERHMAGLCVDAARGEPRHPSSRVLPDDDPGR